MTFALTLNSVTCAETDQPFNHNTVTVFTLELSRECLLVLLVLQCHRLRPLELLVHLIRYHPGVHRPADHGDQQETLEDPPLPPGAHPVSHVGPAPLPAVCTRKPRLCCWKLRSQLFFFFFFSTSWSSAPLLPSSQSPSISRLKNTSYARTFPDVDIILA